MSPNEEQLTPLTPIRFTPLDEYGVPTAPTQTVYVKDYKIYWGRRVDIIVFKQRPEHKYYDPAQKDRWTVRWQTKNTIQSHHVLAWKDAISYLKSNGW